VRKDAATLNPVAAPVAADANTPIKHITPEEAVAHIQALLVSKQERAAQTPPWPDAGDALSSAAGSASASIPGASAGSAPAADDGAPGNAPRDDLGKRGD
jgi:hypothetical protein